MYHCALFLFNFIIIIIIAIIFNKNYFPIQVPSHVLMGIPHSASFSPLSPLGEACSRRDLTAIHEVLENVGYKDDEGVANEVLYMFQMIMIHSLGSFFFIFLFACLALSKFNFYFLQSFLGLAGIGEILKMLAWSYY